jgi:hypothetical protein
MSNESISKVPALKPVGNDLAYQHNHLIRAPLKMGVIESRIFIQALSSISRDTTEFSPTVIPISLVMREPENGNDYADIKKACDALVSRILDLVPATESKTRTHKVPLMSEVQAVKGTGTIRVTFNDKAKPYLLQLKESGNFTSADVATLLSFRNPNSSRLYWILKSWSGLGSGSNYTKEENLDNLKSWLLADAKLYPIYTEFKRRILDPIAAEFKAIGYGATWQPVRTGKKTTSLRFSFPRNRDKTTNAKPRGSAADLSVPAKLSLSNEHERFYQKLSDTYGLAPWQVQVVTFYLQGESNEQLKSNRFANIIEFLHSLDKTRAKAALGGYVWSCLTDKYPYLRTIHEKLRANA